VLSRPAREATDKASEFHEPIATGVYRADLHEECDRYIHRVMLPKLRAQVEAEKLTAAGAIDK
jgi:hypothetical protein